MNVSLTVSRARHWAKLLVALVVIFTMPALGLSSSLAQSGQSGQSGQAEQAGPSEQSGYSASPEERAMAVFGTSDWRIASIVLAGVPVALDDSVETNLALTSDLSALSGTVGCNRTSASFTLGEAEGEIVFAPIVSTMMACPEPAMSQERAAFDALQATNHYRREADRVVLSGPSSELVLVAATAADDSADASPANDFEAFNAAVANAAEAGALWPAEALRVAMAYVDLSGATDITVTLAPAETSPVAAEAPNELVVTFTELGLLDDSLSGAVQRVELTRSGTFWVVVGQETSWLCRRGPNSQVVAPERCP